MYHQCPYCSGKVLRHISANRIYWYCGRCHQEVPLLKITQSKIANAIAPKKHTFTSSLSSYH
ncbi:MAG: hypothetical protein SAJ12_19640 [Jaaginema sp. PMC 1079.18]|nr:hypothetical protein [Jaaginema sp. PMC 1080.18]MEC4853201.1 hypothetical protein [Jaaginema sp. PMC 1079.18]